MLLDENRGTLPAAAPIASPDESLAAWLNACGHPLNMRCSGRGLCRGCEVDILPSHDAPPRRVKACQTQAHEVLHSTGVYAIRIPRASRFDGSLTGVSAFDVEPQLEEFPTDPDFTTGLAIDIGTTTLAAAFWQGSPPRCTTTATLPNPQIRFGDNVVSRVQYAVTHPDGASLLHRSLIHEGIKPLLARTVENAHPRPSNIPTLAVAGNPVMLHTFAGLPLHGFATYPFHPEFLAGRTLTGSRIGLPDYSTIVLLPSIGPFVGADIAAGALACGMMSGTKPALLIDFGTNGEILLRSPDAWLATATAAGPAFEGGRLRCGAAAGNGVVGAILGRDPSGQWQVRHAGSAFPQRYHGIAGAAYVDFLAIGREVGLILPSGRFDPSHPAVASVMDSEGDAELRVDLAPGIFVTEADIAELIQAKAAIQAGWTTLLQLAGIDVDDLAAVYIAGGFGYHLQPAHAIRTGLVPPVPLDRCRLTGNTSLGGASLALLKPRALERIESLRDQTHLVELNQNDEFEDNYIDAMVLS